MRIKLTLLAFLLAGSFAVPSSGQGRHYDRGIYGELLGPSGGLGVNYDARFRKGAETGWGWRAGLGLGYASSSNLVALKFADDKIETYNRMYQVTVPLGINYLVGKGNSKFETGAGISFINAIYTSKSGAKTVSEYGFTPFISLGYRLVTNRGFMLRAGVLPTFDTNASDLNLIPYISFGKSF